jgi:hypothetical protein
MRRFVLGLMIGAGSLAVADQLLDSGEPPAPRQATENETARHAPDAIVDEGFAAEPSNSHQALPVAAATPAPATSSRPENTNPWPSDDAAAARFCSAFHKRKHAEAETKEAAESKDVDWAYPTEQLLEQFVAAHPKSIVFRVAIVDCRTTFCTVEAVGAADSIPVFQDVMREVQAKHFGYQFSFSEIEESPADGPHRFRATLYRNTPKDDAIREFERRRARQWSSAQQ